MNPTFFRLLPVFPFLFGLIILLFLFYIIRNITRVLSQQNEVAFPIFVLLVELMTTLVAPVLGFERYNQFGVETPFASRYVVSLMLVVWISILAYWASRTIKSLLPVWANWLLLIGIAQGLVLNFLLIIHFFNWIPLGFVFPVLGFELVAPVFNIFLLWRGLLCLHFHLQNQVQFALPHQFSGKLFKLISLVEFRHKLPAIIMGMILLLGLEISVLILMDFPIDALPKTFSESVGFTFSKAGELTWEIR